VEQVRPNPEETSGSDGESEAGGDSLEAERARVNALRLQLARTSRATATLQRQLDDVPGRAELAQYQRRFLELYNQGSLHEGKFSGPEMSFSPKICSLESGFSV